MSFKAGFTDAVRDYFKPLLWLWRKPSVPLTRYPYKPYRNDAGEMVYDAPHEYREEFTLHIKTEGVFWSIVCDQVDGLLLCGTNLTKLLSNFEYMACELRRLNGHD